MKLRAVDPDSARFEACTFCLGLQQGVCASSSRPWEMRLSRAVRHGFYLKKSQQRSLLRILLALCALAQPFSEHFGWCRWIKRWVSTPTPTPLLVGRYCQNVGPEPSPLDVPFIFKSSLLQSCFPKRSRCCLLLLARFG